MLKLHLSVFLKNILVVSRELVTPDFFPVFVFLFFGNTKID